VSNNRALVPVLASLGAAAVGVVAYAFSGRRQRSVPPLADVDSPPLRESGIVPRAEIADPSLLEAVADLDAADLDAEELFPAEFPVQDGLEELTVQPDLKVPALASADDAEPPSPDDLGSFWLAGATQSERSLTELDLQPDVETLADLRDELGEKDESEEKDEDALEGEDELDEDAAQDAALAAVERR
jgi:hypothetical protein